MLLSFKALKRYLNDENLTLDRKAATTTIQKCTEQNKNHTVDRV